MSEEKKSAGFWAFIFKGFTAFFKGFKFLKIAFAAGTFASYSFLYSWKFAIMVLLAIGFHESGHVWAMKNQGIKTKGFYFIPFLGGAAIAEEEYKTEWQQAFIAIMGPVWGFALAAVTYVAFLVTHNPLFAAVASWMALVNLFNLLPINPLDGGQLMKTITFSVHGTLGICFLLSSVVASFAMAIHFNIGIFYVLILFAFLDLIIALFAKRKRTKRLAELKDRTKLYNEDEASLDYIKSEIEKLEPKPIMSPARAALVGLSYVGLVGALYALMEATAHIPGADLAILILKD